MEPSELRLFPIAPRARGYFVYRMHPHRATSTVSVVKPAEEGGGDENVREYHLHPDFKLPAVQEAAFGVAEAAAAEALSDEGVAMTDAVAATRQWTWFGAESVYPYWVVSRLTSAELRK